MSDPALVTDGAEGRTGALAGIADLGFLTGLGWPAGIRCMLLSAVGAGAAFFLSPLEVLLGAFLPALPAALASLRACLANFFACL